MDQTPAEIIDAKGGPAAFAEPIEGVSAGAARIWKHHNRFPRARWPEISAAYEDLTTDALLAIERTSAASAPKEKAA